MVDRLKGTPKEKQPEYAWEIETVKHLLEVTHIGKDGRPFTSSEEYTPNPKGHSANITLLLHPEDRKLEVVPHHLQVFKNPISLKLPNGGTVYELSAGIIDGKSTAFIELKWTREDGCQRQNQFFFENDEPAGCNIGFFQGPEWPLNRPAIITSAMRPYFSALGEITPDASQSLAKCTEALAQPGPEFSRGDDFIESFPQR